MPGWLKAHGAFNAPDEDAIRLALERARHPLGRKPANLSPIRDALWTLMWDDVGIVRDAGSLERARGALDALEARLDETGVAGSDLAFNLTWHDWLNLKNQILVSKSIRAAAQAREDSRGAHYRADFPRTGDLETSRYTCVRLEGEDFEITTRAVEFTRVKPGESLIKDEAEAA
jgi:fumarate reductase flavoprotein subunit